MNITELRLFAHLCGTLHFARTSVACNISPSALSRTIQRLEEELSCTLFLRDKRSVALTAAGRTLSAYAQEALAHFDQLRATISAQAEDVRGEVVLFCSVTAAQSLLDRILPPIRANYPQVGIRILTGDSADAIERVIEGSADLSIAARPEKLHNTLTFHELARTPLVFIAPADAGAVAQEADRLERNRGGNPPFILAHRALSRRYAERWFRRRQLQPKIYAEVSGHEAIIAMVQLGFGVGVVPRLVLEQSPLAAGVRVMDLQPALPDYQVGLCAQRRRLGAPAVRAFWNAAVTATPDGVHYG